MTALIMSKNYLKFSQSNSYSARQYECNYVFMRSVLVLFSAFNQNWFSSTGFGKNPPKI